MQPGPDLELLEHLVLHIESLSFVTVLQDYFGFLGAGINAGLNWFLFRYHFINLLSYEFFIQNYNTTSHFARNRYNTFKVLAITFFPIGLAIVVFSLLTRFNTVRFIEMFGTSKSFYFFTKPSKFKIKIKP